MPQNNTNWIDQGEKLKRHKLEGGLNPNNIVGVATVSKLPVV